MSVGRWVIVLCLAALCSCADDSAARDEGSTVTLVNETGALLVPYEFVAGTPPRREADPAGTVPPGGRTSIDPAGFDTLYYADEPKLGFAIEFALDATPARVTVRSARYQVPPGAAASDPALAPLALLDQSFHPRSETFALVVRRTLEGLLVALEEN